MADAAWDEDREEAQREERYGRDREGRADDTSLDDLEPPGGADDDRGGVTRVDLPYAAERLLEKRSISKSGCWEWGGYRDRDGYGLVSLAGKERRVHRVAAALWLNFDIGSSLFICHHCDNPPCFNPAHLFPGTPADNAADARAKSRLLPAATKHPRKRPCAECGREYEPHVDHRGRSITCSNACLRAWRSSASRGRGSLFVARDVNAMRELRSKGLTFKEIGAIYGVGAPTIYRQLAGKRGHLA